MNAVSQDNLDLVLRAPACGGAPMLVLISHLSPLRIRPNVFKVDDANAKRLNVTTMARSTSVLHVPSPVQVMLRVWLYSGVANETDNPDCLFDVPPDGVFRGHA